MIDPRAIAAAALLAGLAGPASQDQPKAQEGGQAPKPAAEAAPLSTEAKAALPDLNARASYGFGLNIGRNLRDQCEQLQVDPKQVARGIMDGLDAETKPLLTDAQLMAVMEEFQQQLLDRQLKAQEEMAEKNKELAAKNLAEGAAYREQQAKKSGVKKTANGLLYEVLAAGNGASPALNDAVTINYQGALIDGTVFDSTEGRPPMTMEVVQFVPGFKEALQLMKVGAKWRVIIPPELGYGETGTPGGPIPPNATLVFEIELLNVTK